VDEMNVSYFENLINQKLLTTHTCYLAKVLSVNGNKANVQPLSLVKAVNSAAKRQAVINNVPICRHALEDVLEGSTVVCACMERDISQTRNGVFALPSLRRHSLSDSIIIGVL
jgi:hypothetical protein